MPPFYWYYKSFTENNAQQFSGQYYNVEGVVQQFTLEQITPSGSTALEYRLFEYDSLGTMHKANVTIEKNQVYPFLQSDNIQRFKIQWNDPLTPSTQNSLNRGRIFQKYTNYNWKGKEVPCAEFLMVETIDVEEANNGVQTIETTTKELFAKEIGLVYYQKKIGDKINIEYELEHRESMAEFEKKFQ